MTMAKVFRLKVEIARHFVAQLKIVYICFVVHVVGRFFRTISLKHFYNIIKSTRAIKRDSQSK